MRILVVEDDERIVRFVKRGLEAEDHHVECVMTKPEAVQALKVTNYDAIILDVFLGPDNGLELCRELRKRQDATPILVVSAMGSPDMKRHSFLAGADAFLAKPFAFDDLISSIQEITGMKPEAAAPDVERLAVKKILLYSHDTDEVEHIRGTLSICQFLLATIPELSIKIITSSPIIGRLRIPEGIEYARLPGVTKTDDGVALTDETDRYQLFNRRAEIVLRQVVEFQPDLVLVDKTPHGVQDEMLPVLSFRQEQRPQMKMALILQDIIDSPMVIKDTWKKRGYFETMEKHYDQICVLGSPRVFDPRKEYGFSPSIRAKTQFLGYIRRSRGMQRSTAIRSQLGISLNTPFVVVTAGGGDHGKEFFENYLNGLGPGTETVGFTSLMVLDADMSNEERGSIRSRAEKFSEVSILDATDDLMSYLEAADLVVSRGGYRSMCEILTLNKAAIAIPRVELVQEQSIRASRMAHLGILTMIHHDVLTAEGLVGTIQQALNETKRAYRVAVSLSLDALPRLGDAVANLLQLPTSQQRPPFPADDPGVFETK